MGQVHIASPHQPLASGDEWDKLQLLDVQKLKLVPLIPVWVGFQLAKEDLKKHVLRDSLAVARSCAS